VSGAIQGVDATALLFESRKNSEGQSRSNGGPLWTWARLILPNSKWKFLKLPIYYQQLLV